MVIISLVAFKCGGFKRGSLIAKWQNGQPYLCMYYDYVLSMYSFLFLFQNSKFQIMLKCRELDTKCRQRLRYWNAKHSDFGSKVNK